MCQRNAYSLEISGCLRYFTPRAAVVNYPNDDLSRIACAPLHISTARGKLTPTNANHPRIAFLVCSPLV